MQPTPPEAKDASGADAPISDQQTFWNSWNTIFVGAQRGPTSLRQAEVVEDWLGALEQCPLSIVDVGCGTGWMCRKLLRFGAVTGIDLSDEVLAGAQVQNSDVRFVAGDFMEMDLTAIRADVVVTLEVLAHVADQGAFLRRIVQILKPGGYLMLATQNRFVLERSAGVAKRAHGQIRQWVDRHRLRALIQEQFELEQLISICPYGHGGVLRIVNSPKLNYLISRIIPQDRLDRLKERFWLGHTLMALARRRD